MSSRPFFQVALALLAVAAVATAAVQSGGGAKAPSDAPPAVVSAVAPVYPPAAWAARATGVVFIEVKVDSAGAVTSAEWASGHPLLKDTSLQAARRWRFAAAHGAEGARTAKLTFLFDERKEGTPEAFGPDLVTFMPPYTVEVRKGLRPVEY